MTGTPAGLSGQSPAQSDENLEHSARESTLWSHIPRGNSLDPAEWRRRHHVLQWILGLHIPALFLLSLLLGRGLTFTVYLLLPLVVLLILSQALQDRRRLSAVLNTAGLTYSSIALVVISGGNIEAHFHFFIMIGIIALYQDWAPLLVNIGLTVLSHGLGSALRTDLIFNHPAAQQHPWLWAGIHGVAVLVAYAGVVAFWGITEDDQKDRTELADRLNRERAARQDAALEEINAVFLNIAHRSQAIVHRQLQVLDKAERAEEDPDQLGLLFQLDHLTTRERRNAENLIILGGGQPGRQWRNPVPLLELVRSAASETEQYTRVAIGRMPRMLVAGRAVGDLIHLLAELLDNATSFSPPDARIDVRGNRVGKGVVLEIEDQGLGIEPDRMAQLNEMLRADSSIGPSARSEDWRLGLFVVSRLARRHGITVTLTDSAYGGVRAIALLPLSLLSDPPEGDTDPDAGSHEELAVAAAAPAPVRSRPSNGQRPQPRPRRTNGRPTPPEVNGAEHALPDEELVSPERGRHQVPAQDHGMVAEDLAPIDVAAGGTPSVEAAPVDAHPAGAVAASTAQTAQTRPGLPTRRRQSHVAPELRDEPALAEPTVVDGELENLIADDEAAQEARFRMSAFQRGTAGGRNSTHENS